MIEKYEYDGTEDAEFIFENIMHRMHWIASDRDILAEKLQALVKGQHTLISQNEAEILEEQEKLKEKKEARKKKNAEKKAAKKKAEEEKATEETNKD